MRKIKVTMFLTFRDNLKMDGFLQDLTKGIKNLCRLFNVDANLSYSNIDDISLAQPRKRWKW